MTPAAVLLEEMKQRGVTLGVQEGRLNYEGDLDDQDVKRLRTHKDALLALLLGSPLKPARPSPQSPVERGGEGQPSVDHPPGKQAQRPPSRVRVVATPAPAAVTRIRSAAPQPRRPPPREVRTGRFAPHDRVVPRQEAPKETPVKPSRNLLASVVYGDDDEAPRSALERTNDSPNWLDRLLFGPWWQSGDS